MSFYAELYFENVIRCSFQYHKVGIIITTRQMKRLGLREVNHSTKSTELVRSEAGVLIYLQVRIHLANIF